MRPLGWSRRRMAVAMAVAGCGSPSSNNGSNGGGDAKGIETQQSALDPTAKGPAAEVPGAKKGGTITVYSAVDPEHVRPDRHLLRRRATRSRS